MALRSRTQRRPCNVEWRLRHSRPWRVDVRVPTKELLASPVALWEKLAGVGTTFEPGDEEIELTFYAGATTAQIAERIICRALARNGVPVLSREAKPL